MSERIDDMPAGTAGIQVHREASEDIQVNLGFRPCRNDDLEEDSLKLTQ